MADRGKGCKPRRASEGGGVGTYDTIFSVHGPREDASRGKRGHDGMRQGAHVRGPRGTTNTRWSGERKRERAIKWAEAGRQNRMTPYTA